MAPLPLRYRFRRKNRIVSKRDFERVCREGSRARGSFCTVALRLNDLEHSRLGLSVGKRCWKSAVRRNRVRRVFREAFRLTLAEFPAHIDVVLIASSPRIHPDTDTMKRELLRLIPKALGRFEQRSLENEAGS